MNEAQLRQAAEDYVYTVWDDEELMNSRGETALDHIQMDPCQAKLRNIDNLINDLVEYMRSVVESS